VTFRDLAVEVNKGISCQLNKILKTKDGERFGSKSTAADDFAGINVPDFEEDEDDVF